ncbi:pilus assembly protein CpaB [Solimonas aquatica]|uniref:Pilus assembly protein CpaB n=1 Tax=Solimonas aquatica TaxID=489703 RepID=A0A1H9H478_9GAMM|nr:Flp pilus assembly protein CpaB [Solimonas aquatica]SEQ57048.1 pilus assembly protein CpaB [Solimonas aquatica]
MSSTALKIFAGVAVLAAIVLAALGYRMSRDYAQKSEAAQQQVRQQAAEQTLAVVAVKPLLAYQPIAREAVALVPVSVRPADPIGNIDEVVGKQPLIDIDAGAPVTHRYFREGNVLARAIPPGYKAVSIGINDVLAVGGFLRPGDIVDILIFLRGAEGASQPQSRVLLEKVRVLAYLDQIIDRPAGAQPAGNQPQAAQQRTAVLAIPDKDTTKLMLGSSLGDLRLALHGQSELQGGDGENGALAVVDPKAAERVITSAELARLRPVGPPTARIEVVRGNDVSAVSVK